MFQLIKTLTELSGPVGQEGELLDYMENLWQEAGATTRRTKIGNVLAHVGGSGPKLLLVAHADELCYLVRAIEPSGFIWLANGQRWTRTTSLRNSFTMGQKVRVLAPTGPIPGFIATATGHLASLALPEPRQLTWQDFWVETGLTQQELTARGVTPGTRIIWEATTEQYGPYIVGKALDDRVLLAVLTELLKRISPDDLAYDITLACTVQEEIGLIGASALTAQDSFEAAIVTEIGLAGDIPGLPRQQMPLRLGAGPVLVHKDSMVHYDYALTQRLAQVAEQADISIQHAVFGSFGSDGAELMRADIPTALIAFPARYTHTPFEMGHQQDIAAMVDWLQAFVQAPPA